MAEQITRLGDLGKAEPMIVDLNAIKHSAANAHKELVKMQLPNEIEPYVAKMRVTQSIAQSSSLYTPLFRALVDHLDEIPKIDISWRISSGFEGEDEIVLQDTADVCEQFEKDLGVKVTPEKLLTPIVTSEMPEEVKKLYASDDYRNYRVIDLIKAFQDEFLGIAHAGRIIQVSKLITAKIAPHIQWPRITILPITTENQIQWELGGFWGMLPDGHHIIGIREPNIDYNFLRSDLQEDNVQYRDGLADKYIGAAHEAAGHASFAEIFDPILASEILNRNRQTPDVTDILSEGYAILIEDMAARQAYSTNQKQIMYFQDQGIKDIRRRRQENLADILMNDNDPQKQIRKTYTHGKSIIRQLLHQLKVDGANPDIQLKRLRDVLSTIDLQKTSTMVYGSPEYLECLIDPLNKLPRVG